MRRGAQPMGPEHTGFLKEAYRGDFKDIALDPKSGMLFGERVGLLEEHHRRKSRSKPEHPVVSVAKGVGQGAAYAGGAVAVREVAHSMREGAGLKRSLRNAGRRGLGGAIIGGVLGAPVGLALGALGNAGIYKSKQVQKKPAQERKRMLGRQVEKALGYTTID